MRGGIFPSLLHQRVSSPSWLIALLLLLSNAATLLLTWSALQPLHSLSIRDGGFTSAAVHPSDATSSSLSSNPATKASPDLCDLTTPYPLDFSPVVRRFCNAAGSRTFPYRRPTRYTRADLAVTLLTVDTHKVTRDEAVMHSWLTPQRLPFGYFGVSIPRPPEDLQPTLPIPHTSDVFVSNLNKTFISLRELYLRFPHKHWFVQTSDDAYFDVDALLLKLDAYDSDDVLYIGGAYREDWLCWNTGRNISYIGGGSGFALSRGFMKRFASGIERWMAEVWLSERGREQPEWVLGDIMVGCFMDEQGIRMTHIRGGHGNVPVGRNESDRDFPVEDHRWWAFHYVAREEMIDVDLFMALQRIDQMERWEQWEDLVRLSRENAVEHHWQQKRSLKLLDQCNGFRGG